MEPDSQIEDRVSSKPLTLEDQLREIYGRVAYAHKTHEKMADGYVRKHRWIKGIEIVVSSLAFSSLVLAVFGDSKTATIIGAVLATLSLGITLYFKEAAIGEQVQKHTHTASRLWGIRERLLSLLVDYRDGRGEAELREVRDSINAELEQIYKAAPRTDAKAYAAAQNALKNEEELHFSDAELDHLLPAAVRKRAR